MKDKIFELVAKGYEVSFRRDFGIHNGAIITLRKKNLQNNMSIDTVMGPADDMLLWTLDKLEKSIDDSNGLIDFEEKRNAVVQMTHPKSEYLERYFDVNGIKYTVVPDLSSYVGRFTFTYCCELTKREFDELQTFLNIIK